MIIKRYFHKLNAKCRVYLENYEEKKERWIVIEKKKERWIK